MGMYSGNNPDPSSVKEADFVTPITDYLILGPHPTVALPPQFSDEFPEFDCVVSILAGETTQPYPPPFNKPRFFIEVVDTPDSVKSKLDLPKLEACARDIAGLWRKGRKVYIHCQSGVSRSATFSIAALMIHKRWSRTQATDCVGDRRPEIKPNGYFVLLLKQLEEKLQRG